MKKSSEKHVYLVEDDLELSMALKMTLETEGFICHDCFTKEEFFQKFEQNNSEKQKNSSSIILDIKLGNVSGLDIFGSIHADFKYMTYPVIFLTGHGDISLATYSLKNGAFDFLTKPVSEKRLLETINLSMVESQKRIDDKNFIESWIDRKTKLTEKETDTMYLICSGNTNKEISSKMGNSVRTVELHRARIFEKLKFSSAVELASNYEKYVNLKLKYNVK